MLAQVFSLRCSATASYARVLAYGIHVAWRCHPDACEATLELGAVLESLRQRKLRRPAAAATAFFHLKFMMFGPALRGSRAEILRLLRRREQPQEQFHI